MASKASSPRESAPTALISNASWPSRLACAAKFRGAPPNLLECSKMSHSTSPGTTIGCRLVPACKYRLPFSVCAVGTARQVSGVGKRMSIVFAGTARIAHHQVEVEQNIPCRQARLLQPLQHGADGNGTHGR